MPSIAVVGGGFGGVAALVMLDRAGYEDVTVFERRERLGGVWHENTYPGAACVVAALRKMERRRAGRITVRQDGAMAFDRELRARLAGTVWHSGCTNWYLDGHGNDPNQWPWRWSTYRRRTARISEAAYEVA
jgi:glycine/D-amino acid oxidase-like deaminating enzyme